MCEGGEMVFVAFVFEGAGVVFGAFVFEGAGVVFVAFVFVGVGLVFEALHVVLLCPGCLHLVHLPTIPFLPAFPVSGLFSSASLFLDLFGRPGALLSGGGSISTYGVLTHKFSPLVG
jgi:hypothetical protein